MLIALGSFADLPLWADPDFEGKRFRRDLRQHVLADPCPTCRAPAGSPCHRQTVAGPVVRRLPHSGRGGPSLRAHNSTYRGGK